jgi:hypothetical protein
MREFGRFLWKNKLWWITPMVLVLALFGFLIFLADNSQVAPFTYVLF